MSEFNIQQVMKYLPHRYPFLLVDKVLEVTPGESLLAVKNVSFNENYFAGHFPKHPVMPGVLIVEALAQASGILVFVTENQLPKESSLHFLAGVDKARFKRVVEPGDVLTLSVDIIKHKKDVWKFDTKAMVDEELVCSVEITNVKKDI